MANTLLIRYRRIGDGIIVLPLVMSLASRYPEDTFTVLTNARFMPLQETMPPNVVFLPMVTKKTKGLFRSISYRLGLLWFRYRIPALVKRFDKVAFLQYEEMDQRIHEHIRNKRKDILVSFTDDQAITDVNRVVHGCTDGLTMIGEHKKALARLGYEHLQVMTNPEPIRRKDISGIYRKLGINPDKKRIAVSPFSREETKIYPLEKMEQVIARFADEGEYQVLVFGGGVREAKIAERWEQTYPGVVSSINKLSFEEEIILLTRCSASLVMDSANLHFGAFMNVPVVSIWGATLPRNGYYPETLPPENCIVKELPCQPCSVFGQRPCTNPKTYDCLDIDPDLIVQKLKEAAVEPPV